MLHVGHVPAGLGVVFHAWHEPKESELILYVGHFPSSAVALAHV